ncbi:MAG: cupin domain-containing protein [Acidobacteriaceae bacterium]|nr:cupin domain-containing protein [Acidobacteriaceae bacterium]
MKALSCIQSYTRRDLAILVPLLATVPAAAETEILPSKCYPFNELASKTNASNQMEVRDVFRGTAKTGCPLALHISTLPPGAMPHPAHHHLHEEMMLIKEGTLQATIEGHSTTLGPGSVIYINSNEEHGLKNVGNVPAQYFVIEIGRG